MQEDTLVLCIGRVDLFICVRAFSIEFCFAYYYFLFIFFTNGQTDILRLLDWMILFDQQAYLGPNQKAVYLSSQKDLPCHSCCCKSDLV